MPQTSVQMSRARLNRLAWLLDNSIKIPGINFRVGLEGFIGLIPGLGDMFGVILSSAILVESARMGAPMVLLLKMAANIATDALVGVVPFFGDIFDFVWKANHRNVQLLNAYLDHPQKTTASSRFFVWGLVAVLAVTVCGAFFGVYVLLRGLLGLLFGA